MAKYHHYPAYQDSGIDWIGEIPKHWLTRRVKFLFRRMQRATREQDGVVTAFRDGEVTLRLNRRIDGFTNSVKEIGYQGVRKGDLVVHAMDGFAGAIGVSDSDGKCSPVCSICIPARNGEANTAYYGLLLRSMAITGFVTALAKGIRERSTEFRYAELKELAVPFPPRTDQDAIIAFLDHETAKIDRLIARQERLIELLKEKRQAVISHAVTKGLTNSPGANLNTGASAGGPKGEGRDSPSNPDAPMKDSGVEWLGVVPAHWNVKRLKHISPRIGVGLVINPSTYVTDEGVPFLFGGDVIEYGFKLKNTRKMTREASNSLPQSRLSTGDLVCVRVGYPGITAVIPPELEGSNCASMMVIKAGDYNSYWLCYAMNSWVGRRQVERVQYGAAQKQYNIGDAIEFVFPVPPNEEQSAMAIFLDDRFKKFEELIKKAEVAIALQKEHRTALISAAVTGKIDVRGWQQPNTKPQPAATAASA